MGTLEKWWDLLERDDKNDPLFCGFVAINFFATWENVDYPRPQREKSTEKWVVFIKARKLCSPTAIRRLFAGKGSPRNSAWIMSLCACDSRNLSKALQFGSTLAGMCPRGSACREFGACNRACGVSTLGSDIPFWVSRRHVVVFPSENAQIDGTGRVGKALLCSNQLGDFRDLGFCCVRWNRRVPDPLCVLPSCPVSSIRAHSRPISDKMAFARAFSPRRSAGSIKTTRR